LEKLYNTRTRESIALRDLINKLHAPHIFFFGEIHENQSVVNWELRFLKALYMHAKETDSELVVGMEHFNIEQQGLVDDYIKERIGWRELVDKYNKGPEGFNLNYYKPILDYARTHRIKVIGLMPPRTDAKIIARKGADQEVLVKYGLRRTDISMYPKEYRDRLIELFPRQGPMASIDREKLVLAQSSKDQIMAKTITERMNKNTLFYAIMGSGHCEHVGSVPDRVRILSEINLSITVVTVRVVDAEETNRDVLSRLAESKYIITDFLIII
jgi:uncharacterized iron-regulated protein